MYEIDFVPESKRYLPRLKLFAKTKKYTTFIVLLLGKIVRKRKTEHFEEKKLFFLCHFVDNTLL